LTPITVGHVKVEGFSPTVCRFVVEVESWTVRW